jgi:phosphoglycerol transferase MdoB-like AlkP superfamily enzyme
MTSLLRTKSRYRIFLVLASVFIAINLLTRIALLIYEGDTGLYQVATVGEVLAVGLLYDFAALSWILPLFALNALIWPNSARGRRLHQWSATVLFCAGVIALLFQTMAEFLFWNEFSARFNFIAVDYLVYTREVVGNIWQSYPLEWLLLALALVSLVVIVSLGPTMLRFAHGHAPTWRHRLAVTFGIAALPGLVFLGLGEGPHNALASPAERELASNGLYSLFRAFRNNDLDFDKFYATRDLEVRTAALSEELVEAHAQSSHLTPGHGMERQIVSEAPKAKKNVVLISIESLGSDYVEAFGGRPGLTPNLSALTDEGLSFHNLYATGLRTVRGLEAITLSVPPTPGHAVPVRENNRGLMSIGSVLKENGYDAVYIYGGYSIFDNMRAFFSGNGYDVRDRTDIASSDIHHETIWGVADEDLFDLALRELDQRAQQPAPFFAHIMTTSNHRPYTYPEGRIDIPSHTGRDGAVKYTDWAIGKFLRDAKDKPWFADTVFVILADHTSHGRGRVDLPPENYRIPMWIYAPGFVKPGRIDYVASQIDIAPTVLGLLNLSYTSRFFGQDILREGPYHQRAFLANYLTVGYMEDGLVVELAPQDRIRVLRADDGTVVPNSDPKAQHLILEAISYYQTAAAYIHDNAKP